MANIPSSGNCLPFCNHSYITGFYTGTHWKVGWICKWVQKYRTSWIWLILMLRYINFWKADAHYHLMEYATLKKIWDCSGLSGFWWKKEQFDCDDFVVCLKAAMGKWCYKETVHPFGKCILFEPQNGQTIPTHWTHYLQFAVQLLKKQENITVEWNWWFKNGVHPLHM